MLVRHRARHSARSSVRCQERERSLSGPPAGYGPSPRYSRPDDYGPPPRPPHAIPYAVSPRSYAVRPAVCDRQWQCGPWGCGWRRVCFAAQPSAEHTRDPTAVSLIAAMVRHRVQATTALIERN
jgi:hypothetical protein